MSAAIVCGLLATLACIAVAAFSGAITIINMHLFKQKHGVSWFRVWLDGMLIESPPPPRPQPKARVR